MPKTIVLTTAIATSFCLAATGCDAEDLEDRLHERAGLCVASSEHDTLRLELRDPEVAAVVSAPADVPPSVHLEFEGTMVQLNDDGLGPDRTANDGIFTAGIDIPTSPFDEYCLSGPEELAVGQQERPLAFVADEDPQGLPPDGDYCHEWMWAWSGAVQVWYCACFAWDRWSC